MAPKVDGLISLPRRPLVPICSKIGSFVFKILCYIYKIGNKRTDGRTEGGRTNGLVENILPEGLKMKWGVFETQCIYLYSVV